jgi:hypothetical protein
MAKNADGTVTLKTTGKTGRLGGKADSGVKSTPAPRLPWTSVARVVKTTPKGKPVKTTDRS